MQNLLEALESIYKDKNLKIMVQNILQRKLVGAGVNKAGHQQRHTIGTY